MQKTTNYNLNQWEDGDRVTRADFNADNAAIDAALKAVSDAVAGKAWMETLSYVGTGTYGPGNPTVFTFQSKPDVILIVGDQTVHIGDYHLIFALVRDENQVAYMKRMQPGWNDTMMAMTSSTAAKNQANSEGVTYYVYGLHL